VRCAGVSRAAVEPSGKFYKDWDCAWYEVNEDGLITEVRAYLTGNFGRTHSIMVAVDDLSDVSKIFDS